MATEIYRDGRNRKTLVFAGTFEGHGLARFFSQRGLLHLADFCVATEYGAQTYLDIEGLSVIEGRLNEQEMESLIRQGGYAAVIDATHPYAKVVTENIRAACLAAEIEYIRLLRREGLFDSDRVRVADSIEEAVELLNQCDDRVLLTTGSKELHKYRGLKELAQRAVARVLPSAESIAACQKAGIPARNIICMQGPFTEEMNLATMRQYGCQWIVTKNTGKPGGFDDKIALCEAGYDIVVIGRPAEEEGFSYEEVLERLEEIYGR